MVFWESLGLYSSPVNERALEELVKYLESRTKEQRPRSVLCYEKYPVPDAVISARKQLMAQVKENLHQKNRVDLHSNPWHQGAQCGDSPVLVFCLHSSSLGTDVNQSLKEFSIADTSAIVLIVFHHVAPHADVGNPTDSTLSLTRLGRVKLVLDMVFWESAGLYSSPVNEEALEKLVKYLESRAKEQGPRSGTCTVTTPYEYGNPY
ncbi:uncharacterized protein LOC106181508 [Lingula anatina]|uniref:Uncharacterized protein LOC106181508 n=1 Tax=Lingula anatina TaxID=7574 RepID=A0A1S3KFC9_LINAN|nr:uncharacterized protein LOC106181508 [Lingula anatina]|eukprot:XP_013421345.1 uncharacterized protein LOC106181508 [Lingula anatina]